MSLDLTANKQAFWSSLLIQLSREFWQFSVEPPEHQSATALFGEIVTS